MNVSNEYGWRAKIGLLLPSSNLVVEPWFNHVAPHGVSFHVARMPLSKVSIEAVDDMVQHSIRAAREVADAQVQIIAYCCTAATLFKGPRYNKEIIAKLSEETKLPVTTAMDSILKGLSVLGLKRIIVVSPYRDEFDRLEIQFFNECGIEVLGTKGMGISDPLELAKPSPEEVYQIAKATWKSEADGMFISCLNLRAQAIIDALEADICKPVVTAVQATLWNCLRLVKVNEVIRGYGRLLKEF